MRDLEFAFEQAPWEAALAVLRPGDALSAVRFLTLLEGEPDSAVEDALAAMEEKHIDLDVTALPKDPGSGQMAARLAMEARLDLGAGIPEVLEAEDPLRIYLEEVAATPMVLIEPEALAQRSLAGDESAQAMLANCYLSRVTSLSMEYTGRGVLLLDLIQEGSLGLWQGIQCYRGGEFDAHGVWWIRQYMARAVTLQARESGVGRRLGKSVEDYQAADKRLLTTLGRNPALEEIAQELGVTTEEAEALEDTLRSARRMADIKKEPEPQEEAQAVEDTAYFQSRQRIGSLLSSLDGTDAEILRLRFGLEGGLPLTPQQAGAKLGLPAQEILEREKAALKKLRQQET